MFSLVDFPDTKFGSQEEKDDLLFHNFAGPQIRPLLDPLATNKGYPNK